jgi:hypothetical protein
MDKKHNPLTAAYPRYDKLLALFRKAMIISETTELEVDFDCYGNDMAEVRIYPSKKSEEDSIFWESIHLGYGFEDSYCKIRYVFNHILQKGSFPKSIPEFDSFQEMMNRTKNLINSSNKLKQSK